MRFVMFHRFKQSRVLSKREGKAICHRSAALQPLQLSRVDKGRNCASAASNYKTFARRSTADQL